MLPLVAVVATLLAGCSLVDGDADSAPTTTEPAAVVCPDGEQLPSAAAAASPAAPAAAAAAGPARDGALDVGTSLPRTGALAFLGAAPTAAVELAGADIAAAGGVLGAPVTLHPGDSADGTPGAAEAETERLLAAGVDVIVGPMGSGVASRVIERVSSAGAVLVTPGATSSGLDDLDGDDRLFRTVPTEALQGRALAELVLDDGPRAAALVVRADDYGRTIADAFTDRFEAGGGIVRSRLDYEPTDEGLADDAAAALADGGDAVILVGLAEVAGVVEALADAGAGPADRPVYGTDGNLGERLADLVTDPAVLACMKGVLPVAPPPAELADRLRRSNPELASLDDAALEHAGEAYDAVVLVALAAQVAGTDAADAIAAALAGVSRGGTPCDALAECLPLAMRGSDFAYEGATGPAALDGEGNRTAATVGVVTFDDDGHLARVGTRAVPS